jgi:hypothetical protein
MSLPWTKCPKEEVSLEGTNDPSVSLAYHVILIRERRGRIETHRGETSEDGGRNLSKALISQAVAMIVESYQRLAEFSLRASRKKLTY